MIKTKQKNLIIFIILVNLIFVSAVFADMGITGKSEGMLNSPSAPTLISPVSNDIDLTGKDSLDFIWIPGNSIYLRYYDFRVYKGYNTVGANLILKEQVPATSHVASIKAETFEVNQVYTWVLRAVAIGGEKSDKSFESFKIIKK